MTYNIHVLKERSAFILNELKDCAEVKKEEGEFIHIEVTISNGFDLIRVFHAGIECGSAAYSSPVPF